MNPSLYEAGAPTTLRHAWHIRLNGMDHLKAIGITRIVEFWCQRNCGGLWRVEQRQSGLTVSFEVDRDAVFFRMGELCDRLAPEKLHT